MAQHKSAKKRARQTVKRQERNRQKRSAVQTAVKKVREAVAGGDSGEANQALRRAEGILRRAGGQGAIPRKRASRRVSRLAKAVHALSR